MILFQTISCIRYRNDDILHIPLYFTHPTIRAVNSINIFYEQLLRKYSFAKKITYEKGLSKMLMKLATGRLAGDVVASVPLLALWCLPYNNNGRDTWQINLTIRNSYNYNYIRICLAPSPTHTTRASQNWWINVIFPVLNFLQFSIPYIHFRLLPIKRVL